MREFESAFEEGLRKGLRSEEFSPALVQQLIECRNLRPKRTGLLPVVSISDPFYQTISWPFPQVLVGRNYRLLCSGTTTYTCDDEWDLTIAINGLTEGELWDMAEFGDFVLLANGSVMVQRNGATGAWTTFASSATIPGMKTVCGFRGQLVGGNITSDWYDCESNYVAWSDIGSASFEPGLRNEAGYTIMPFSGDVMKVMSLSDLVVVYGENGIAVMKPAQQYFALAELSGVGIPWKGAVGGSDREHVFVDYNGELWRMGAGPKLEKLGYQEYMSKLDASQIVVSYNSAEHEYYISDGTLGFLLTEQGLCETFQLPTSVAFVDGQLVGVYDSDEDLEARVVTDVVDFGIRSFKTVSAIEIGGKSPAGFRACVDWRSDISGSFARSTWLTVNPTGFVTPIVTANDFRLAVKATSYVGVEVRYLIARVKNVDKRSMRGIPVSGAGLRR